MKIAGILLKIAAAIAGAFMAFWGYFIGIIGIGPDGPVPDVVRSGGIAVFVAGLSYWIPNGLLIRSRIAMFVFLAICAGPYVMLITVVMGDLTRHGVSSTLGLVGIARFVALSAVLSLAPASLALRWKMKASNQAVPAIGASAPQPDG
jgi:hypothetical protein